MLPPRGVFSLPACWRPCGARSLPRPLPGRTSHRPAGGGGRRGSVQPAGPAVTRRPEAPPPRRESQRWDELRERWSQSFPSLLFFSFTFYFPSLFNSLLSSHSSVLPFFLSSFLSLPFLSPLLLLLCLSLRSCEEGGGGFVGTAAVAPAGEGGWLTGVVGAELRVGGGRAGEYKALAEREKKTWLFFFTDVVSPVNNLI